MKGGGGPKSDQGEERDSKKSVENITVAELQGMMSSVGQLEQVNNGTS